MRLAIKCASEMEHLFRRSRVLKTLLSLSLVLATFLMIQKFKVVDFRMKEVRMDMKNSLRGTLQWKTKDNVARNIAAPVRESAPATWNISAINCTADSVVLSQSWFQNLDPRFHRFVLHRHCRYFPMIMNHPEKCAGDVDLLIVVKSVIEQHDRRQAVRLTWGKEHTINGKRIKTLFLLGTPAPEKDARNLQKLIEYEDRIYGDILQWNFMDTFFNLTLKEINFLRWFNIYCKNVRFIFKGDDDVFVNPTNLVDLIDFRIKEDMVQNLFAGDTISKAVPIRNQKSKYFIPKELYDKPYPPYAGGGGFVMSSHLARRLFTVSEKMALFPIDDVFLGMCLQELKVAPEKHPGFKTFGIVKHKASLMNSEPCFYRHLIVVHKMSPEELMRMWDTVHDEKLTCTRKSVDLTLEVE
ncbi:UDP-GlcNAc:betaGal beta-1,3-N-acetylglucosaminyltransferase 7, like [Hemibagrus wyckioides]|uniref:UDP-GlcNAc:betaGal beta-1,3-N-acetylglucosaminyltransferase 7, like n=1 Tax=Hemibagrus wyckioides TaxID=337641 RepID=UPI00266BD182|nr:UDP-GlcNAc:betaGal beta-1,3-N-acetylglucosaminyltransferase 7, like [Hemibagrus wyckioides]